MEKILKERNITSLYHFTKAANLKSIFQHGLLSRNALKEKAITAKINDRKRRDRCRDAVSTSIMFPNYKMFWELRNKKENKEADWAILKINARIILNGNCAFNWTNAADHTVSSIPLADRMTPSAFSELFEDKAGYPQRSTLNIPDYYPTNPQAEVLVFSDISVKDIVGVYFEKKDVADRYLSDIPRGIQVYIDRNLFYRRKDWRSWKNMAKRPVFEIGEGKKMFQKREVEFKYNSGFADIQKKKNIDNLHQAYLGMRPNSKILEISTKSDSELGVKLSAFNLQTTLKSGKSVPLECIFQASKVFEYGGPYDDLIYKSPREAKKDERLKKSGKIIGFRFCKRDFSTEPKTLYYNWLYVNTLNQNKALASQILDYSAFTDIEFNPEKSINCQAEAAAIFVSLKKKNLLDSALASMENFIKIVYPDFIDKTNIDVKECTQLSVDEYFTHG